MNPTAAVTPTGGMQNGGWYGGQQYWNGQLGAVGVINNPNQQGYGQKVSDTTIAQTNPNNVAFVNGGGNNGGVTGTQTGGSSGMGTVKPTLDLKSVYDSAVTNNPDYQAAVKDLAAKSAAHDTAIANVNDNPFYSEGRRVGEQEKVDAEWNADQATANNTIKQIESAGQIQVNLAQGQYNINRQDYQDQLSNLNFIIQNGGLENASPSDLANYSVATGIPLDMLSSMKGKANTQIVTSTDNAGNLSIVAVDKNTGKTINETTLNGAGKAKNGTSSVTATQSRAYAADASQIIANIDANYQTINGKLVSLKKPVGQTRQGDKLLSKPEAQAAYDQILAKVGDPTLAQTAFTQAMQSGGYQKWGQW